MSETTEPMHVAFVIPHLGGGGGERSTLAIAGGLAEARHSVDVLNFYDPMTLRDEMPEKARFIRLQPGERAGLEHVKRLVRRHGPGFAARLRGRDVANAVSVAGYLDRERPDVVLPALAEAKVSTMLTVHFANQRPTVVPIVRCHLKFLRARYRHLCRLPTASLRCPKASRTACRPV